MEIMGCCLSRAVSKRVIFDTTLLLPESAKERFPGDGRLREKLQGLSFSKGCVYDLPKLWRGSITKRGTVNWTEISQLIHYLSDKLLMLRSTVSSNPLNSTSRATIKACRKFSKAWPCCPRARYVSPMLLSVVPSPTRLPTSRAIIKACW